MITNRHIVLFWIWNSWCVRGANGTFGFLFGDRDTVCNTGTAEDKLTCQVAKIYESAGLKSAGQLQLFNGMEQGERGLACIASIAGIDLEQKLAPLGFAKAIVFEQFFDALNGSTERIDRLCSVVQSRRRLQEELMLQGNDELAGEGVDRSEEGPNLRRRRLGTPKTVDYPSVISTSYSTWAGKHVVTYLDKTESGMKAHSLLEQTTKLIYDPLVEVRQTIIDAGVAISRDTMEIVCSVLGMVEVGFDPGDACRIVSTSLNLIETLNKAAQGELELELFLVDTHNALIDSAQVEAAHMDSAALVTALIS